MKICRFCAEEVQDAAIKCKHCGELLEQPVESEEQTSALRVLGMLMVIGCGTLFAYSFGMNTSVETGIGRVNNLGLMQQQNQYMMVGGLGAVFGILLAAFGGKIR